MILLNPKQYFVLLLMLFLIVLTYFFNFEWSNNDETNSNDEFIFKKGNKFLPSKELKKVNENDIFSDNEDYNLVINVEQMSEDVKVSDFQEVNDEMEKTKRRFRSFEMFKKESETITFNPKTETQVLKELTKKYISANNEQRINILNNIEYLIHDYDVALDFVKLNGLKLILPDLNNSDYRCKEIIAKTLGSAAQNNVKVQMAFLESGALDPLLGILSLDSSIKVKSSALFAISALIRLFPPAQKQFVEKGGVSLIASLFKKNSFNASGIKLRIIHLLYDLLTEQEIETTSEENVRQYREVHLKESLKQVGFCAQITPMLKCTEFEIKMEVLSIMNSLIDMCIDDYKLFILVDTWLKSLLLNENNYATHDVLRNIRNLSKSLIDKCKAYILGKLNRQ
ncbi:nucleotide exchange factor SIL1-like protein [Dinothrombium tinctorium]|uniref:Nucleotide exchange factor SIL1 n=1 Tax=Dinothrombium tinctorium TaxID=1965070 RepID=A0A3S4QCL4_9ACAR|nr:nucleotide exchange factor SIL1-like protein [Dinothrombium tinctorium]